MSITEELKPLFYPDSVAVIGASGTVGKVGNIILGVLKKTVKNLYPVHPKAEEILGDRKSTRLNSSHIPLSRMPSSA